MPTVKRSKHMITITLATLFSLSVVTGCDKLIPPDPDSPSEVPHERDPGNPGFIPPETSLSSNPALSSDPDTSIISTDSVTFTYSGNLPQMVFQYRFDGKDSTDWSNWSPWMDTASVTFSYLDEGLHTFDVRAGYSSITYDSTGVSRTFDVQAYDNTLRFNPSDITLPINSSGTIELWAEDVIDLMAVTTTILYNRNYIHIDSVTDGIFMTDKGQVLKFAPVFSDQTNTIEINMAVVDQTITGQTEGGPVVTIHFTTRLIAVTTEFSIIESSTTLIDLNNGRFQPTNLGKARIIITTGRNDR